MKIEKKIRKLGYEASSSTVRHYIADWKKSRKFYYNTTKERDLKTVKIERKNVFKLLYHPVKKSKQLLRNNFKESVLSIYALKKSMILYGNSKNY